MFCVDDISVRSILMHGHVALVLLADVICFSYKKFAGFLRYFPKMFGYVKCMFRN